MIEKRYAYTLADSKTIEKVIEDDHVAINHIVLGQGDSLPEHYSNSNVYMTVIRGGISLRLDDQDEHTYPAGSIIAIPYKTKMNVYNTGKNIVEFFVTKAPSPKMMNRE